jgi:hypothetical protein
MLPEPEGFRISAKYHPFESGWDRRPNYIREVFVHNIFSNATFSHFELNSVIILQFAYLVRYSWSECSSLSIENVRWPLC